MARKNCKSRVFATALRAAALLFCFALPQNAAANDIETPYIEEGEWAIEHQGILTLHDRDPEKRGGKTFQGSVSYSPTDWYYTEVEGEWEREGGESTDDEQVEPLHYQSINWTNIVALAEPGEYWIDPAFFVELEFARHRDPNNAVFGLIAARQIGPTLHTVNLFGHKEYGHGANPNAGFIYSGQSKYLLLPEFQPGFEVFGDTEGHTSFRNQQLAVGPGIFGELETFEGQTLTYEMSYLFGVTPASPDRSIRWKVEYGFSF